jgi:phosphoserine aminotransferase
VTRVRNCCAGPCTLPVEVLSEVQQVIDCSEGFYTGPAQQHGGLRASIHNAMPDEGVDELAGLMRDFARSPG